MSKTKLRVYWMDGYEELFNLTSGTEVKIEPAYIFLIVKAGERYIPLQNVRWFAFEA